MDNTYKVTERHAGDLDDRVRIATARHRMNEARKALHEAIREGEPTTVVQRLNREYADAFDAFMGYAD